MAAPRRPHFSRRSNLRYLLPHGVFDHPVALTVLLAWAGMTKSQQVDFGARREADLERLADVVEAALDWGKLAEVLPGMRP